MGENVKLRVGDEYYHLPLGRVLVVALSSKPRYRDYPVQVRVLEEGSWQGVDIWVSEKALLDKTVSPG